MSNNKIDSIVLDAIGQTFTGPLVSRAELSEKAGISSRGLANLDSQKRGPTMKVRIGRAVFYPKKEALEWIQSRLIVEVRK